MDGAKSNVLEQCCECRSEIRMLPALPKNNYLTHGNQELNVVSSVNCLFTSSYASDVKMVGGCEIATNSVQLSDGYCEGNLLRHSFSVNADKVSDIAELYESGDGSPLSPEVFASPSRQMKLVDSRMLNPPVRDLSCLRYIKVNQNHEKYPSWPVSLANANCDQSQPINTRSHSCTDHTNSSTEFPIKQRLAFQPGLRPLPERISCSEQREDISSKTGRNSSDPGLMPVEFIYDHYGKVVQKRPNTIEKFEDFCQKAEPGYLNPQLDSDGHRLGDQGYSMPSPPERDMVAAVGLLARSQRLEMAKKLGIVPHDNHSHKPISGITQHMGTQSSHTMDTTGIPLYNLLQHAPPTSFVDRDLMNVHSDEHNSHSRFTGVVHRAMHQRNMNKDDCHVTGENEHRQVNKSVIVRQTLCYNTSTQTDNVEHCSGKGQNVCFDQGNTEIQVTHVSLRHAPAVFDKYTQISKSPLLVHCILDSDQCSSTASKDDDKHSYVQHSADNGIGIQSRYASDDSGRVNSLTEPFVHGEQASIMRKLSKEFYGSAVGKHGGLRHSSSDILSHPAIDSSKPLAYSGTMSQADSYVSVDDSGRVNSLTEPFVHGEQASIMRKLSKEFYGSAVGKHGGLRHSSSDILSHPAIDSSKPLAYSGTMSQADSYVSVVIHSSESVGLFGQDDSSAYVNSLRNNNSNMQRFDSKTYKICNSLENIVLSSSISHKHSKRFNSSSSVFHHKNTSTPVLNSKSSRSFTSLCNAKEASCTFLKQQGIANAFCQSSSNEALSASTEVASLAHSSGIFYTASYATSTACITNCSSAHIAALNNSGLSVEPVSAEAKQYDRDGIEDLRRITKNGHEADPRHRAETALSDKVVGRKPSMRKAYGVFEESEGIIASLKKQSSKLNPSAHFMSAGSSFDASFLDEIEEECDSSSLSCHHMDRAKGGKKLNRYPTHGNVSDSRVKPEFFSNDLGKWFGRMAWHSKKEPSIIGDRTVRFIEGDNRQSIDSGLGSDGQLTPLGPVPHLTASELRMVQQQAVSNFVRRKAIMSSRSSFVPAQPSPGTLSKWSSDMLTSSALKTLNGNLPGNPTRHNDRVSRSGSVSSHASFSDYIEMSQSLQPYRETEWRRLRRSGSYASNHSSSCSENMYEDIGVFATPALSPGQATTMVEIVLTSLICWMLAFLTFTLLQCWYRLLTELSEANAESTVTSYQSTVTSYQSTVTSHQSTVTSHQSAVTSHQSTVTSYQSAVTSHQSTVITPVSSHFISFNSHFTPVNSDITPVNSHFTTVNSHLTPVSSHFISVNSHLTPVSSHFISVNSHFTPVNSDITPVNSHFTTVNSDITPVNSHFTTVNSHFISVSSHITH